MRYTLRLLTLDQLGRAATLICALELDAAGGRRSGSGAWPFEIGLWVGKAATPNRMGRKGDERPDDGPRQDDRATRTTAGRPPPIPLENCPWCGTKFKPTVVPARQPERRPADRACDSPLREPRVRASAASNPLPIVAVDEPIYRRLPCFLIATVDKFASLPWTGASGALLGGADRHDAAGFYGAVRARRRPDAAEAARRRPT